MDKTILLIDADLLAYRISAACEKRTIKVIHNKSGEEKVFNTRTEFKDLLKSKNKIEHLDRYSIEDVQTPQPASHCFHSINTTLRGLENSLFPDVTELYLSGKNDNFRSGLLLPTQYKASRSSMLRPLLLEQAKNYLLDKHKAIRATKIEADDVLSIRAYEILGSGGKPIIVTNDKDVYQAEDVCVFDFTQDKPEVIEVPIIGSLTKNKSSIKGMGLKFFAFQLLFGDNSDDYKPSELAGDVRYGATSAFNDLNNLEFGEEILEKVLTKYQEWYPKPFDYTAWNGVEVKGATWETMLDLYFKCAYMKRRWNDTSNWKEFFNNRGVQV